MSPTLQVPPPLISPRLRPPPPTPFASNPHTDLTPTHKEFTQNHVRGADRTDRTHAPGTSHVKFSFISSIYSKRREPIPVPTCEPHHTYTYSQPNEPMTGMEATTSAQQPVGTGSLFLLLHRPPQLARSLIRSLTLPATAAATAATAATTGTAACCPPRRVGPATGDRLAGGRRGCRGHRAAGNLAVADENEIAAHRGGASHEKGWLSCCIAVRLSQTPILYLYLYSLSILSRSVVQRAEASSEERPAADASVE